MNRVKEFLKELHALQNPELAVSQQRYHKSSREHWGVKVPQCAQLAADYGRTASEEELIQLAQDLWKTDLFDPMIAAAKILSLKKVKPSEKLWSTIIDFLSTVDGWALEDSLAPSAWKCLLADEKRLDELEKWTIHPSFWMRRAALVYTLPFAKPGKDPERMLRWAAAYANDQEWFIQKAIGWWLRVLGEHQPERVHLFLKEYGHLLKRVAIKEATRKLN